MIIAHYELSIRQLSKTLDVLIYKVLSMMQPQACRMERPQVHFGQGGPNSDFASPWKIRAMKSRTALSVKETTKRRSGATHFCVIK
ncbi:hypothetical protein DF132_11260 [Burkholderia cenocepacia]|nr:hypothetical protein DF132_11260 [Burkholderia cenocepacia]